MSCGAWTVSEGRALPCMRPSGALLPRWLPVLLMMGLLGGLTACETLPEAPEPEPQPDPRDVFAARQQLLLALPDWQAAGRLALSTENEGWNASFRWHQGAEDYLIRLSGPFGQTGMELQGGPRQATLRTSEPRTLQAADAETLLYEALGWRLPVKGLRYWLTGAFDPAQPVEAMRLDEGGRLAMLEQSGWRVEYRDYTAAGDLDLPSRVFMTHPRFDARVVVSSWGF